jgi:hypothetical protein
VRAVRPGETIISGGTADPSAPGTYHVWVRESVTGEERLAGVALVRVPHSLSSQAA